MTRVRLWLWWAKYHWLNVMHILAPHPLTRLSILVDMVKHDEAHPTGQAPDWIAK